MSYERFVILLKSRSRAHHPHIHYSYTWGRHRTCFPFRSTQKYFTPTLGENTKIFHIGFHQTNAPSSYAISQIFTMQKRDMGYAKVIHKRKKELKKWKSVPMIKTMGTSMPA
jgi:hypothetical protein